MYLLLHDIEARELDVALSIYLEELKNELVHTEMRAYKNDLKARLGHLEQIQMRLTAMLEEPMHA